MPYCSHCKKYYDKRYGPTCNCNMRPAVPVNSNSSNNTSNISNSGSQGRSQIGAQSNINTIQVEHNVNDSLLADYRVRVVSMQEVLSDIYESDGSSITKRVSNKKKVVPIGIKTPSAIVAKVEKQPGFFRAFKIFYKWELKDKDNPPKVVRKSSNGSTEWITLHARDLNKDTHYIEIRTVDLNWGVYSLKITLQLPCVEKETSEWTVNIVDQSGVENQYILHLFDERQFELTFDVYFGELKQTIPLRIPELFNILIGNYSIDNRILDARTFNDDFIKFVNAANNVLEATYEGHFPSSNESEDYLTIRNRILFAYYKNNIFIILHHFAKKLIKHQEER